MTNSSLRFALDCALALVATIFIAGCGPKDGSKELAEGLAALEARDLTRADRFCEKALKYAPDNVDVLVAVARVKLELAEIAAAKQAIARAAALAGGDSDVVLLGAQIAYHARDYEAAAKAYAAFAADDSHAETLRADALVGLAVVEISNNRIDRARVALLRAQKLDRRNAAVRYHLGSIYRVLDYPEAALVEFEAFGILSPASDPRLARVQDGVVRDLRETIAQKAMQRHGADRRDSNASANLIRKGDEAWKKGNFKTAKVAYADALKADPLSYAAAEALARAWLRVDGSTSGKRSALECYQTACSLKPLSSKTLMETGTLAASLGRWTVAEEAYSRALTADPRKIEAIDGLIRARRNIGKDSSAWQEYRDQLKANKKKK